MSEILLCNLESFPDKKYEVLGLVTGMDYDRVNTKNVLDKIIANAKELNADAVINLEFVISAHDSCPIILASGTAIKFLL